MPSCVEQAGSHDEGASPQDNMAFTQYRAAQITLAVKTTVAHSVQGRADTSYCVANRPLHGRTGSASGWATAGAHRVEPVGVERLFAAGAFGDEDGPLAAMLAGGVLPLGLDALLEQVEVCVGPQPARRLDVVVQTAPICMHFTHLL